MEILSIVLNIHTSPQNPYVTEVNNRLDKVNLLTKIILDSHSENNNPMSGIRSSINGIFASLLTPQVFTYAHK